MKKVKLILGLAVIFGLACCSFSFDGQGIHWAWENYPYIFNALVTWALMLGILGLWMAGKKSYS